MSYLVVSVIVDDFYKMPMSVAMIVASVWAVAIFRGHTVAERIEVFSRQAANPGVMYMIWVFILAGAFSYLARSIGAVESTVNFTLHFMPPQLLVPGLFLASCFISLAIGTSVGTVVALTPLAMEMALSEGGSTPLFVAAVLGGAFFGDNLSFISDTTIAATRSQGTGMRAKFRANIWIAGPAALITLMIYVFTSGADVPAIVAGDYNAWLMMPYLVIIAMALAGVNVTIVLCSGIVTAFAIGVAHGNDTFALIGFMGAGIESMGNLIVITLLASGMLGIIKALGGITYLLQLLSSRVRGARGAQLCIVAIVGFVDICTANNTIAIITVGSLAREISRRFGINPRKSASLLDTGSCIVQCLIPYGAQALLAANLAGISPMAPLPYIYYPLVLAAMVGLSIIIKFPGVSK